MIRLISKYHINESLEKSLIPDLVEMKRRLKLFPLEHFVKNCGAVVVNNCLMIEIFFQEYVISLDDFSVVDKNKEKQSNLFHLLLMTYLTMADGIAPSGNWISFRELPNGENYCKAFQRYAPDRIARRLGSNIDTFRKICKTIGGFAINMGDAGFIFRVFPQINVVIVYWLGDESINSNISLLFDKHVDHYMVTDGLAQIGNTLVDILLEAKN